jgi:hypothetical protein
MRLGGRATGASARGRRAGVPRPCARAQGIIFARISHPKNRARTVFISDCAVIARRDSVLKLMFRIADVRQTQVVSPTVSAVLYTWTARTTAEGEHIPVRPALPQRTRSAAAWPRPVCARPAACARACRQPAPSVV